MISAARFLALLAVLGATFRAGAQTPDVDPRVAALLDSISEARLVQILHKLASFETRNTLSTPDSASRGIGAARQWILEEMQRSSPRLQVTFDTYQVLKQGERITRDVELRNVMAVLPGRSPRRVYVSGHYDSLARRTDPGATPARGAGGGFAWSAGDNPAPGVNDDGSGTALVMELAPGVRRERPRLTPGASSITRAVPLPSSLTPGAGLSPALQANPPPAPRAGVAPGSVRRARES